MNIEDAIVFCADDDLLVGLQLIAKGLQLSTIDWGKVQYVNISGFTHAELVEQAKRRLKSAK